ncbi:hypothetical protein BGZ49_006083, partial [Haplosporangium sp. Z 27]
TRLYSPHLHNHTLSSTNMPKHLPVELKGRIVGAFEFGIPQADIARRYGLKTQTVSKVIEKFEKEGTVERSPEDENQF